MSQNKTKQKQPSELLGEYMLKGWCLLQDTCPVSNTVPLVKSREGHLVCVGCLPVCKLYPMDNPVKEQDILMDAEEDADEADENYNSTTSQLDQDRAGGDISSAIENSNIKSIESSPSSFVSSEDTNVDLAARTQGTSNFDQAFADHDLIARTHDKLCQVFSRTGSSSSLEEESDSVDSTMIIVNSPKNKKRAAVMCGGAADLGADNMAGSRERTSSAGAAASSSIGNITNKKVKIMTPPDDWYDAIYQEKPHLLVANAEQQNQKTGDNLPQMTAVRSPTSQLQASSRTIAVNASMHNTPATGTTGMMAGGSAMVQQQLRESKAKTGGGPAGLFEKNRYKIEKRSSQSKNNTKNAKKHVSFSPAEEIHQLGLVDSCSGDGAVLASKAAERMIEGLPAAQIMTVGEHHQQHPDLREQTTPSYSAPQEAISSPQLSSGSGEDLFLKTRRVDNYGGPASSATGACHATPSSHDSSTRPSYSEEVKENWKKLSKKRGDLHNILDDIYDFDKLHRVLEVIEKLNHLLKEYDALNSSQ
ncbi:unnamed protein product [Amoebophrya sp. A120]|nr:unnamed protein product [Amoebophrya sp. A120]|eukprot:GSA120T00009921001.1